MPNYFNVGSGSLIERYSKQILKKLPQNGKKFLHANKNMKIWEIKYLSITFFMEQFDTLIQTKHKNKDSYAQSKS